MRRIGIIGCGTAGIQLAYSLKNDFDVTVHQYEEPQNIIDGRIRSTQVHFHPTLERERRFNMPPVGNAPPIRTIHFQLGQQKLFTGNLSGSAASVDQRLHFTKSMHDLAAQGVKFIHGRLKPEDLQDLTPILQSHHRHNGKDRAAGTLSCRNGTHSLPSSSEKMHRWLFYRSTARGA